MARSESHGGNPHHSSDSNEHGTPPHIVEAAREVLGEIDLDPASSPLFNRVVRASRIYTREDDGLQKPWHGRVFLNPPGGVVDLDGRPVLPKTAKRESCTVTGECGLPPGHQHSRSTSSAKVWWQRLAAEYDAGHVTDAIFVGFSLEVLQATQDGTGATPFDHSLCVPAKRLRYHAPDAKGDLVEGTAPTHSSFIAYLGRHSERFRAAFSRFGAVLVQQRTPERGSNNPWLVA